MQGILTLFDHDVRLLFDTGSTHSFITSHVAHYVPFPRSSLPYYLSITMLDDVMLLGSEEIKGCELGMHDKVLLGGFSGT